MEDDEPLYLQLEGKTDHYSRQLRSNIDSLGQALAQNHMLYPMTAVERLGVMQTYQSLYGELPLAEQQRPRHFYKYMARVMTPVELECAVERINGVAAVHAFFAAPEQMPPKSDHMTPTLIEGRAEVDAVYGKDNVREMERFMHKLGVFDDFSKMVFEDEASYHRMAIAVKCMYNELLRKKKREDAAAAAEKRRAIAPVVHRPQQKQQKPTPQKQQQPKPPPPAAVVTREEFSPFPLLPLEKQLYGPLMERSWQYWKRPEEQDQMVRALSKLVRKVKQESTDFDLLQRIDALCFFIHIDDPGYEFITGFSVEQQNARLRLGRELVRSERRLKALIFAYLRMFRFLLLPIAEVSKRAAVEAEINKATIVADIPHPIKVAPEKDPGDIVESVPIPLNAKVIVSGPLRIPPRNALQIIQESNFENVDARSCSYDSMFCILFKVPGNFLQRRIWEARQVFCRIPAGLNPTCNVPDPKSGMTPADELHKFIVQDINFMQNPNETLSTCATYKLWHKCIYTDVQDIDAQDDPREMAIQMCAFYGFKLGVDVVGYEANRKAPFPDVRPIGRLAVVRMNTINKRYKGGRAPFEINGFTLIGCALYASRHWTALVRDPRSKAWWYFNGVPVIQKRLDDGDAVVASGLYAGSVICGWFYLRTEDLPPPAPASLSEFLQTFRGNVVEIPAEFISVATPNQDWAEAFGFNVTDRTLSLISEDIQGRRRSNQLEGVRMLLEDPNPNDDDLRVLYLRSLPK